MDWIDLAQYRARWLAIVNAVMNESRKMRANSWLAEGLLTSQEGLCSMELVGWLVGWLYSWEWPALGSVNSIIDFQNFLTKDIAPWTWSAVV